MRAPAWPRRHGWARAPGRTAGAGQPGGVVGAGAPVSRRRPACRLASRERCRRDAVEWEGRERTPRTGGDGQPEEELGFSLFDGPGFFHGPKK